MNAVTAGTYSRGRFGSCSSGLVYQALSNCDCSVFDLTVCSTSPWLLARLPTCAATVVQMIKYSAREMQLQSSRRLAVSVGCPYSWLLCLRKQVHYPRGMLALSYACSVHYRSLCHPEAPPQTPPLALHNCFRPGTPGSWYRLRSFVRDYTFLIEDVGIAFRTCHTQYVVCIILSHRGLTDPA